MKEKEKIYYFPVHSSEGYALMGNSETLEEAGYLIVCRLLTDDNGNAVPPFEFNVSLLRKKDPIAVLNAYYTITAGSDVIKKMTSIAGKALEDKLVILTLGIRFLEKKLQKWVAQLLNDAKNGKHKFLNLDACEQEGKKDAVLHK